MEWIKKPTPTELHLVECATVANREGQTLAMLDRYDKGETSVWLPARANWAIAKAAQKAFKLTRSICR